jgi:hypothetical protein
VFAGEGGNFPVQKGGVDRNAHQGHENKTGTKGEDGNCEDGDEGVTTNGGHDPMPGPLRERLILLLPIFRHEKPHGKLYQSLYR